MKTKVLTVIVCVLFPANILLADTVTRRGITIDFVTIDNAGNAADTRVMTDGTTGYGAVGYDFNISKYEVTNTQWNTFKSRAGAPNGSDSGYSYSAGYTGLQQPTNNVSWYEAAQFCNYLTSGDKSKGVYQFSGSNASPGTFLGIDRAAAQATYSAIYFLPTENEWYKAAYYKPDESGYSLYANGLDTIPAADNGWNYLNGSYSIPWDVGIGTEEQNGTFDMMGNAWEWTETLISDQSAALDLRGGAFDYYDYSLASSYRSSYSLPFYEYSKVGFRIAYIPEPASALIMTLAGIFLTSQRKTRRS